MEKDLSGSMSQKFSPLEKRLMEIEELAKKLEWLEREHRKDHATINELQEKLAGYEGNFGLLQSQLKDLNTDLSRFTSTAARLDQFDMMVSQYRAEVTRSIDEMEKRHIKQEKVTEDRRRVEVDNLNKSLIEVRSSLEAFTELRRGIQARADEAARLGRSIVEIEKRLGEFTRSDDELRRNVRLVDEARKNDIKHFADTQGEMAAIRKRAEDAREKADLNSDGLRQLDNRINELLASETDRRQTQMTFIEQQSLNQVDRDRGWKEIQARFEAYIRQNVNLDQQLIALEETQRSVKRSQDAFEDVNTRLERRINEITEIQRLAEDRFRQEWVTFKADDQKRWTNYSLTQDELVKDIRVELERLGQRIVTLDDVSQSLQDLMQQTSETTETQLQELMNWTHEFLTNYSRIMGRSPSSR
jgi:chromosome segregation ATPase